MATNGLSAVALAAALKHRHCERSEAIQNQKSIRLDCFAFARKDGDGLDILTSRIFTPNLSIQA